MTTIDAAGVGVSACVATCGRRTSTRSRGRTDVTIDHALCAQKMSRPSYEMNAHLLEMLRFAWANPAKLQYDVINADLTFYVRPYREPIRPYDEDVCYGLFGVGDSAHVVPTHDLPSSKSMGGHAVMLAAAALEWRSYRFHTMVTDSTSGEALDASRLALRLVYYRRLLQFWNKPIVGPTPQFTDNDGVWYIARDAAATTRMIYIIRHIRLIQQIEHDGEIKTFQVDGRLNPADAFTKWLDSNTRTRHYLFLMGYPKQARDVWMHSKAYKTFVPKKLTPVPKPPITIDGLEGDVCDECSES